MSKLFYVSGIPVKLIENPDLRMLDIYGATVFEGPEIHLRSLSFASPRVNRAFIHEIMHLLDDNFRIGLHHDQIRALATGFDATLRDRRNASVLEGLFNWRIP